MAPCRLRGITRKSCARRSARRLLEDCRSRQHDRHARTRAHPGYRAGPAKRRRPAPRPRQTVRAEMGGRASIDAALASIAEHVPDLILTSTFLPPAALARLIDDLRRRDRRDAYPGHHHAALSRGAGRAIPSNDEVGRVLRFPRQRTARRPRSTAIRSCFAARSNSISSRHGRCAWRPETGSSRVWFRHQCDPDGTPARPLSAGRPSTALVVPSAKEVRALNAALRPTDRRAASRRRAADLAGQWGSSSAPTATPASWTSHARGCGSRRSTDLNPGSLIDLS